MSVRPSSQTAPDESQRKASDPQSSVWVSANAGSGKTHALTTRVARLLLSGSQPQHILCLTYTKAAAAEMSARLYKRLGQWAMCDDASLIKILEEIENETPGRQKLALARQLFARAIETPGGLKIQTIHAFCERLLGRFPLEAGVPPHFDILDDHAADELRQQVRDDILRHAAREPGSRRGLALKRIVELVDETGFSKLLENISNRRARFRDLIETHQGLDALVQSMRLRLGLLNGESTETVLAEMLDIPEDMLRNAVNVLASGTKTDIKNAEALSFFLEDGDMRSPKLQTYMNIFLTKEGDPRKTVITSKPAKTFPDISAALLQERDRLHHLLGKHHTAQIAEATQAVYEMAEAILSGFEAAKRARALLDYDDLIERSKNLLTRSDMAPWVLYKLDGGIDHILVDEAQDTSPDQWEIIRMLSEEFLAGEGARSGSRTIFAVGDEKQSIFSFQGADPAKFDEMKRYFERHVRAAKKQWETIPLVRSFRSVPQILQSVDAVFELEMASDGLTASAIAVTHEAARHAEAGLVEIWDTDKPDDKEDQTPWYLPLDYISAQAPEARLAGRIAATIRNWLDTGERIKATGKLIRPGDILILVRRRNAFLSEMVRALKKAGIPVAGADRMVLTEQMAVMDLMALGQFALLPSDDLTLATVLKGPFCQLSEEELMQLAYGRDGQSLWHVLEKRKNERPVYASAHDLLARLLKRADFEPPYEFYAHILSGENGRQNLVARLGADAIDPVDEFLGLALEYERRHAPSLQGFLHWLERGGAEIKRDMEQGRNEVRIMTVHGAKGLEAPIVFMPDTCTVPGSQSTPALLDDAEDSGLIFWPVSSLRDDAVTAAARVAWSKAQMQEYRRLLYVAMTRARDRLYICGYLGRKKPSDASWYALIMQGLAARATPVKLADGHAAWRIEGMEVAAEPVEAEPSVGGTTKIDEWALRPAPIEVATARPLAPSRLPPDDLPLQVVNSPLQGDDGRRYQRGKLIHRLLQTLPDLDASKRSDAAARFLAREAHRLTTDEQAEIQSAVMAVLNDAAMAEVFAPGSRAEVPLVGRIEFAGKPILVSGQIDRLSVTSRHVLVIDYKTNRPGPANLESVSPAYLAQMAAYRAVLRQIYPDKEIRCALIWTEGPLFMALPDALLDRVIRGSPVTAKP